MQEGGGPTTGPLPIGQFVAMIQHHFKHDDLFQYQTVKGEIAQWKVHNGNIYFSLRDDDGQLNCAIWRHQRLPIDESIKEGSEVIVIGSVDVWPKRGQLQLIVHKIEPVQTLGMLEEARRKLIEELRLEGHLDRKRLPLPLLPKHIAIVTGAKSAALADMQRLLNNRFPNLRHTVIEVLVQGELATKEIVRGLAVTRKLADDHIANRLGMPPVDVVIVGRGGGSVEDLWAFNLEPVARAILASPVPVISAVGHESDVLVSDLIADMRASTPSHAIEQIVPNLNDFLFTLDEVEVRIQRGIRRRFEELQNRLNMISLKLQHAPQKGVVEAQRGLDRMTHRFSSLMTSLLSQRRQTIEQLELKLQAHHPKHVLQRGYTMVEGDDGGVISTLEDLTIGASIQLHFSDGQANSTITKIEKEVKI